MEHILDQLYSSLPSYKIDGRRYLDSMNEFTLVNSGKQSVNYRLVQGHQLFGLHQHLQYPCQYFTMLREPISRIISLYNYLRLKNIFPSINEDNMTIREMLDCGLSLTADNGMTRFIAGTGLDEVPYGCVNLKTLEIAKQNILNYSIIIGLTERFDESLALFKILLGWEKIPSYLIQNKSQKKWISKQELSKEDIAFLEDYLKYDIALYNFSSQIYQNQKEKIDTHQLRKELEQLRKQNKLLASRNRLRIIFENLPATLVKIVKHKALI